MTIQLKAIGVLVAFCISGVVHSEVYVPEELEPWVDWVLHDREQSACPYDAQSGRQLNCAWLREVAIDVLRDSDYGATFRISVHAFAESDIELPITSKHRPHDVKLNSQPATLGGGNDTPRLTIPAGTHEVTGRLSWDREYEPQSIQIPRAALVKMTVDGKQTARPFIDEGHRRIWLTRTTELLAEVEEDAPDTLNVRVFRHFTDSLPQLLVTYVELTASGKPRVIELGKVLANEFELIGIQARIPVSLDAQGRLSVLVTGGEQFITVAARASSIVNSFNYEHVSSVWPTEEIWGIQPDRNIRVVRVVGPPRVNLDQVDAPSPMTRRGIFGYVLSEGVSMTLEEEQRGNVNPNPAKFAVDRQIWLNFKGDSYVVADSIQAETDTELRIAATYVPGNVVVDGEPRLITYADPVAKERPGINIDTRDATIESVSVVSSRQPLSANGWDIDANSLAASLHIPPGWRLLWTNGVDYEGQSWLARWSIWDVFLGLLLVSFAFRIAGVGWAAIIALTVVLTHQENWLPTTIGWLVLAGLAYLNNLVSTQWFKSVSSVVFWVVAFVVAAMTIYSAAISVRQAIYPQLDQFAGTEERFFRQGLSFMSIADSEEDRLYDASEEVVVTGSRLPTLERRVDAYPESRYREQSKDPSALVKSYVPSATHGVTIQTGPGIPLWHWRQANLTWSGPVAKDQQLSFGLLPPWATRILLAIGAVLSLATLGILIAIRSSTVATNLPRFLKATLPVVALVFLVPQDVSAQTPDPAILTELEERLTAPPECLPDCAFLERAKVQVSAGRLDIELVVHAEATIAVALPSSRDSWIPDDVTTNKTQTPLRRNSTTRTYVLLEQGNHTVALTADLQNLDRFDIEFPLQPSVVSVEAPDWDVEGLVEGQLDASRLAFTRQSSSESRQDTSGGQSLALSPSQPVRPYVLVHRSLRLEYEPTVTTTVSRIAPQDDAFAVQIPLLANETVIESPGTVEDGNLLLSFSRGQSFVNWTSQLNLDSSLELTAPDLADRHERWSVRGSDFWTYEYEGIVPVRTSVDETVFVPRSNETLRLMLTRPEPVPGNTATVETGEIFYRVGNRSHETELVMAITASQATDFRIELPEGSEVQSILVGGSPQPIPANEEIVLPVRTGRDLYTVEWLLDRGAGLFFQTPEIELQQEARNIDISMEFPQNRWTVYLGGPTLGAAVLFWGVVLVILLVAIGLSRLPNMPVTITDAILLSLGATLANIWALVWAGAWFLAIWVRSRKTEIDSRKFFYYLKQVAFIALSFAGFIMLVLTVPRALLGSPNMHIFGYGSDRYFFKWFADESGTTLPTAWVFSLPRWVILAAMLAWSLWLAFALVRWTKESWSAASNPEFWPKFEWQRKRSSRSVKKLDST